MTSPPSQRTTVKRGAGRAVYDADIIRSILADGIIAHVGVVTDDGPIVLPMIYGIGDHDLLLHGSVANAMMRTGRDVDVCVTVTIVDGLVVARTPLHNSMNYRSVVIRGTATEVDDPGAKKAALKIMNDHLVPIWDSARPPTAADVRRTMVLSIPLTEASAKIRTGDPVDEPEDLASAHWAGVVPVRTIWGRPQAAADLDPGIPMPASLATLTEAG